MVAKVRKCGDIFSIRIADSMVAEYVRVPFANDYLTKIPNTPGVDDRDYLLLSDIWPAAWKCLDLSGFH